MVDATQFFTETLPRKLAANPSVAPGVNAIYQFDIDGAGVWTVDLTQGAGVVRDGADGNAGCVIGASKADFEALLESPSSAMVMYMSNKLTISNLGLAMSLQKIFS
ncbi:MAG: Sterol-binding domain protein [Xanthobacteraceae bacterium]|jgi:hypothetical protein|nr:Sterol-binding domain protein [Xanthobacteraceae bacterium]